MDTESTASNMAMLYGVELDTALERQGNATDVPEPVEIAS